MNSYVCSSAGSCSYLSPPTHPLTLFLEVLVRPRHFLVQTLQQEGHELHRVLLRSARVLHCRVAAGPDHHHLTARLRHVAVTALGRRRSGWGAGRGRRLAAERGHLPLEGEEGLAQVGVWDEGTEVAVAAVRVAGGGCAAAAATAGAVAFVGRGFAAAAGCAAARDAALAIVVAFGIAIGTATGSGAGRLLTDTLPLTLTLALAWARLLTAAVVATVTAGTARSTGC